jgi:hypothetical protein
MYFSFAKQLRLSLNSSGCVDGRRGCLCHGDILLTEPALVPAAPTMSPSIRTGKPSPKIFPI